MSYRRLLSAWLILAFAMPINGAFRELVMKPRLADPLADAISAALGILIILGITRLIFRIPADAPTARLARMSALLVVLTIAFETTFGLIEGQTLDVLLEHYAIWKGNLWPLVLLVLAATPFLWRGRRGDTID